MNKYSNAAKTILKIRTGVSILLIVFVRTLLLYCVIILSLRCLGKRQIGEMEPSELVVAVMLSELATVPIQDNNIPLITGFIPVISLVALEIILSQATMLSPKIRAILCGVPSVVIDNGVPVQSAMRKNRLSIDELMEQLRSDGFTDIADVRFAILETGGHINIIPRQEKQAVTCDQLGLKPEDKGLFTVFINDGRILEENLKMRGLDRKWLKNQMKKNGAKSVKEVFLLSANEALEVRFFPKEGV